VSKEQTRGVGKCVRALVTPNPETEVVKVGQNCVIHLLDKQKKNTPMNLRRIK